MSNYPNYYPPPGPPPGTNTNQPPTGYPPYYQAHPDAPPPVYQQPIYPPAPGPSGLQGPLSYYPRVGFTRLSSKFQIWNVMTSGGTSCLQLGPQLKGTVAYCAKMFSSSRLKIKEGPYASENLPICTIESRHTFSSKSTVTFDGFQANFAETSQGWPVATFEASGGNTFEDNAALGVFEFHGPAAVGQLGDIFANVSIAILLRIISQHYISRIAALAGS
ncbi:hypothetical protein FOC1_g10013454 [Fusarium oxysporum f. sp. cubense race 1]|uniref:Uncharacterized protein n=1 Tax=Fusarium oxysporum f. sp. cubense (strain race 1) TaxID=1229664 RepID=N4UAA9_FUSC1|nr:hypothetical protein FOC1_g10013454 [Fusarium oxysporum f. sp. cubense race 1]